ncbi:unnamed protein product [Closterium sp. NIES-64]|nr:unnamed protein product [Closterium sp. NIES-64]
MVHYVDVHLPWTHSLCACCLPRMLRPAPPVAFQISSLTSLRKHLQQSVPPSMPPFLFGHKPPCFITAYSATVRLSAPPPRPPGRSAASEERAAAPSVKQQYRWKVDSTPVVAADAMMLEWMAEPRLAFQFGAGRQARGDCLASLLLQVLGLKGKEQLETGFAAHLLPLLPGGRHTHGQAGGGGGRQGTERGSVEEWREGLGGVEWEEYVQRVGEIVAQGEFTLKCATVFCQTPFARAAAIVFSDCAGSRHKESVEGAAVEEAVTDFQGGREAQRAVEVNPAEDCRCFNQRGYATALPHRLHDLPNLLQRFGAVPNLPAATCQEGLARMVWEEFPEGDRAVVAEVVKDTVGKFFGQSTFHVGAFRGDRELDKEEVQKEYNVREFHPPPAQVDTFTVRSPYLPGGEITVQVNTSGPIFPTLGHRVEEFLRRFAPTRLAREGRNDPLAKAIISWAGRSGLGDRAWAAMALGRYAHGKIKPILRSEAKRAPGESGRGACPGGGPGLAGGGAAGRRDRLMLLYLSTLLLTKENALPAILEPVSNDGGGQVEGEKQQQQQQGGEEWRMWEEVDSWRMAAGNAWPAVEAHDSPLQMGAGKRVGRVEGEVSDECCVGMRRAMKDAGKRQKGRVGAWYLVPWPGGVNPLACLREMLLGETSYCPQAHVDAGAAAVGGAAAAAPGEGRSSKGGQRGCVSAQCGSEGGPRGCASPRCGKVEGVGVQLKVCARCDKAAYCSRECHNSHWPSHKLICQVKGKEKVEE